MEDFVEEFIKSYSVNPESTAYLRLKFSTPEGFFFLIASNLSNLSKIIDKHNIILERQEFFYTEDYEDALIMELYNTFVKHMGIRDDLYQKLWKKSMIDYIKIYDKYGSSKYFKKNDFNRLLVKMVKFFERDEKIITTLMDNYLGFI